MLINCDHSRSVWLDMNVNVANIKAQHTYVTHCIISWFDTTDTVNMQCNNHWVLKLMITSWSLWKNRCLKVFENKNQNILSTVHSINNMVIHCSEDAILQQESIKQS